MATLMPDGDASVMREGLVIDGGRVAAASGRTFASIDPATGDVVRTVAEAGAEDVDRAVRAAARAFEDGGRRSPIQRATVQAPSGVFESCGQDWCARGVEEGARVAEGRERPQDDALAGGCYLRPTMRADGLLDTSEQKSVFISTER